MQTNDTSLRNRSNAIDTERGGITFSCGNLLDREIMLAVKAIIENNKINDVKFLQKLQEINQTGEL